MIYSVKHFWSGDEEPAEYFIESDKNPTPMEALKILNDNGEQIDYEPENGEEITVRSLDVKRAIPPKKKYEHLYSLGFSVLTDEPESATVDEMWLGLYSRFENLEESPKEILEACGLPDEITEN